MKPPVKPKKPSKNTPKPNETCWAEYGIFEYDDGKIIIKKDDLTEEELESSDYWSVTSYLSKKQLKEIEKKFNSAVDYKLRMDYYEGERFYLEVCEKIPEEKYAVLLKNWENRFSDYEKALKKYEIDLKKYNQFKKEEKLNKLKKEIKKLQAV